MLIPSVLGHIVRFHWFLVGVMRTRTVLRTISVFLVLALIAGTQAAQAQDFSISSVLWVKSDGSTSGDNLFLPDHTIRVTWNSDLGLTGATLHVGSSVSSLSATSATASGSQLDFTPSGVGLGVGAYVGQVVADGGRSSNTFSFYVEASSPPSVSVVRDSNGDVTDKNPRFLVSKPSGVPAIILGLSSTAFELEENDDGELTTNGGTATWAILSSDNELVYGQTNPDVQIATLQLEDFTAPPLKPGTTYYFTALNAYEDNNGPVSAVVGSIESFTFVGQPTLTAPVLIEPADDVDIFDDEITFTWDPVEGASNYKVNIYRRDETDGNSIDIAERSIDAQDRTSTTQDVKSFLVTGRYSWEVVASDDKGNRVASVRRVFDFTSRVIDVTFKVYERSSDGNFVPVRGPSIELRNTSGARVDASSPNSHERTVTVPLGSWSWYVSKSGYETEIGWTYFSRYDGGAKTIEVHMQRLPLEIVTELITDGPPPEDPRFSLVSDDGRRYGLWGRIYTRTSQGVTTYQAITEVGPALLGKTYTLRLSVPGYEPASWETYLPNDERSLNLGQVNLVAAGLRIEGRIINDAGEPIQSSRVYASQRDAAGVWLNKYGRSDADGNFSFEMTAGTPITIRNNNYNYAGDNVVVTGAAGETVEATLVLTPKPLRLLGNAYFDARTSSNRYALSQLSSYELTVLPEVGDPITLQRDQRGWFQMPIHSPVPANFQAYVTEKVSGLDIRSEPVNLTYTTPGEYKYRNFYVPSEAATAIVSGRIDNIEDGEPIGGVTVYAQKKQWGRWYWTSYRARADQDGRYELRLPSLQPESYRINVYAYGYDVINQGQEVSMAVGQQMDQIDFSLRPGAAQIGGRVVDQNNNIVRDANVVMIREASRNPIRRETVSDVNGNYSMEVSAGRYRLRADKVYYESNVPQFVYVGPGQYSRYNTLQVTDISSYVTGRTASDTRIEARLIKRTEEDPDLSFVEQTGEDGNFSIRVLSGYAYQVIASKPGYFSADFNTEILGKGMSMSQIDYAGKGGAGIALLKAGVVDIQLQPAPAVVSGQVLSPNGQPVTDAWIVARQNGVPFDSTLTTIDGTYELGLADGTYGVSARSPGLISSEQTLSVSVGTDREGVDYRMVEFRGSLSGRVTDASSGAGLANVLVSAAGTNGAGSTRSNADGSYVIPDLYSDSYTLTVSTSGYITTAQTDISLNGGETLEVPVALEPFTGTVSGIARDVSGNVVADANITVTHELGTVFVDRSGSDGTYSIGPLPLGEVEINAEKIGLTRTGLQSTTITQDQLDAVVDFDDFEVAGATFVGTVTDSGTGQPLQGVQVSVSGSEGAGAGQTDSSGQFTIDNLAAGSYEITFTLNGYLVASISSSVAAGEEQTTDQAMNRIQARITGTVTDQLGAPTGYLIDVVATSSSGRFGTRTGTDGSYVVPDLPPGTYRVETTINREGFTNTAQTVVVSATDTNVSLDLAMTVGTGVVSGVAGASGVKLELVDPTSKALVKTAFSSSAAAFSFSNLLPGTYRVEPELEGYVFQPATASVTAVNGSVESVSFTAVEDVGTVTINVADAGGSPIPNISVRAISENGETNRSRTTSESGETVFRLPGGQTYYFSASAEGLIPDGSGKSVAVSAGSSSSVSFTMTSANASISGTVRRNGGGAISGAVITATNVEGQSFSAVQTASGYTLSNLPPASYSVGVTASGFRPTSQDVVITPGQNQSGVDFELEALSVSVSGRVVSSTGGVSGLTVALRGLTELTGETDSDGRFSFADVPIQDGSDRITSYSVAVSGQGIPARSTVLSVTGSQIGSAVAVPDILIPSGKVDVSISDGSTPINQATVSLISNTGQVIRGVTGENGLFSSGRVLAAGTYEVSVSAAGRMSPVSTTVIVELDSDIDEVVTSLELPYIFQPADDVFAAQDTEVRISVPSGFDLTGKEAVLRYQFIGDAEVTEVSMSAETGGYVSVIPAMYNLNEITYSTRIRDTISGISYRSKAVTTVPSAAGVLTQSRVTPSLAGIPLRVGDTYEAIISMRDGLGELLTEDFQSGGGGVLQWSTSDPSLVVSTPDSNNPTRIEVEPTAPGTYTLTAFAQLGGASTSTTSTISVTDSPVAALSVATSTQRAVNTEGGVPLSVTATLENGSLVRIGSALQWSVTPSAAGSVEGSTLSFLNSGFFGPLQLEALDEVSSQRQSVAIDVLAPIDGNQSFQLTNLAGLEFDIPSGAVPVPATVGLAPQRLPAPKRNARVGQDTYQVEEPVFLLSLEADQAIPGDSLQAAASLTMPLVSNRFSALSEGERSIGFFDVGRIQWRSLSTAVGSGSATAHSVFRLGEFAILSANEPLGLKHAAVLPSPFSPDIAPLKIGYLLQTSAPPAVVDIHVFSLMGERVRTLIDGEVQQPGRYGSETSLRPIEWDGLTDSGQMARNGRYVIRITAKDDSGEVTELIPVVLVK